MALNRSLGAAGVGRKISSPSTKVSGIPSATKTLKTSDHSLENSQKVTAAQLADGKATSGTSPKPRSGVREKVSIPGKTVSSCGGGTGINSNAKINIKSATSSTSSVLSSVSTHSISGGNGPGRLPTKLVAKARSGRISPKLNGLPDVGRVVTTELHSKSDVMLHTLHASSAPQTAASTVLRVDKSATKSNGPVAQPAQTKVGLPVSQSNKRLLIGSLNLRPSAPAGVTKGKSPPLSSAINSENSAKTEQAKARKTTGIAKFQNHPSSAARSVTGTTTRHKGLPVLASIGTVRASVDMRTNGVTDLNNSTNTSGRDTGAVRKDVRTKTGQPTEKVDNAVGTSRHSALPNPKNIGLVLDNHTLPVLPNQCMDVTENQLSKISVHPTQDLISKTFEETVEDVSECEYFSETRSTVSENLSEFPDLGPSLDITDGPCSLERVHMADLRQDAEGNMMSLGTSLDDIFASCEDIVSLGECESSQTSDHTDSPICEENCNQELVEESFPVQTVGALLSHVGFAISDHDLQVTEDYSTQHDLQIVEDGDYSDGAPKHCVDSSVVCEHVAAADIPDTSFYGITDGSNSTVFGKIDLAQTRPSSGKVFEDRSEAMLNDDSLFKKVIANETLSQCASPGYVDEWTSQAEDESENQPLQDVTTTGESFSKCPENQNSGDEVLRTVRTMTPDVDQELRIIEEELEIIEELTDDFNIRVDNDAMNDAELEIEDMTTSSGPQEPAQEDASVSEVRIEDVSESKVTSEDASDVSVSCTIQKMRVAVASISANGQEQKKDMETEGKCRGCSSDGFGADGVTDTDGDGSPRADSIVDTASTPIEASAAAAQVDQVKVCGAISKDDDDSVGNFLGDSCETLKCEYESDVDPDLMKETDGVSAAGCAGSYCRNQACGSDVLIPMSAGCTDIIGKSSIHINNDIICRKHSWTCCGDRKEIDIPTQVRIGEKSRCMCEIICNSSSSGSSAKVENGFVSDCPVEDEILRCRGRSQSGDQQCQDVDRSRGLPSFCGDFTLLKNNGCEEDECVVSDTNCALNGRDNNASNQDGKDGKGSTTCLPGAPGQLSSSFINEFSAWFAAETVTGSQSSFFDPGASQLTKTAEADFSSASLSKDSSVIAMDTENVKVILAGGDADLKYVDEDVEEFDDDDDDGLSEKEEPSVRENIDSNYKLQGGSFFSNSHHQQERVSDCADSSPQTFNSDLCCDSTDLRERHRSAQRTMPLQTISANTEGTNVDRPATKFVQMAESATDSSVILPRDHLMPNNNEDVNKTKAENLVQNQKTDECLGEVKVFQNPEIPVLSVANQPTIDNKATASAQIEGDPHQDKLCEQEGTSVVDGTNKFREPMPRPTSSRKSLPASLNHANMISKLGKGLDSSIHRGPSPLSVLTDRPVNENSKDGGSSQNLHMVQSDIPLLSIRRFRPITVQDYFTINSSSSLNFVGHETSQKATNDELVDTGKVIKDANQNVVMTKAVSVISKEARPPTSEMAGFLSPRYVPSRPLSQICSRTMGNSLRRNIGCHGDGDNTSLTSVESLPTVDSSGNTPAKPNVLAQIRFARSCSRIGLKSPISSEDFPEDAYSTPRLPVAGSLPCFDLRHSSSGGTLSPQTPFSVYSRTDSSRQSQCSTPVVGDCPSPCSTPTMSSGFERGSLVPSRNATARLSRHQAMDEDVNGSFVSLASVSSTVFSSSAEEKQGIEFRKLKHELEAAKETIISLKTQLNVNALMSKTYEQNIEGLTQRLKQLATIIEQKESELCELRSALKNTASNGGGGGGGGSSSSGGGGGGGGGVLHTIPDCVSVGSSFHRRSSNSSSLPHDARIAGLRYLPVLTRHISCESVNSLNSQSSSCSMGSQQSATLFSEKKKKKKNWIRSSFSKAFSRKKKTDSVGEPDSLSLQSDTSANEPLVIDSQTNTPLKNSPPEGSQAFPDSNEGELEKRLRETDMELTELRLEQLASIQNIEHLQEKINLLEQQVATLKAENKSLQRLLLHQGSSPSTPANSLAIHKRVPDLVRQGSLRSSSPGTPLPSSYSVDGLTKLTIPTPHEMSSPKLLQRFSLVDAMASDASYEQLRRICVYVLEYGSELHSSRGGAGELEEKTNDTSSKQIGVLMLSEQTSWLELDLQINNLFMDHIHHLDPETGLGLDERSIASYRLGIQERIPNSKTPDALPSKNLPASNACIKIRLRDWQEDSVDFLAFDTLVPKLFLHQYVSLLLENRRLLFCGPNLSGKTFLAKKLARHLVLRKDKKLSSISIAQFTVDSKSSKELQQYLSNIVSHCEQASDRLPSVIVIDNLHLADNLSKAFSGFFSLDSHSCPYLIGTMTQSRAASITCLQFHQNFRWVLFGQTDEPMKSFLARYLHRQLAEKRFRRSGGEDGDCGLLRVVDWMPKVWHHVNRFVTSNCSPDKCIGPGIFLPCPMDVEKAQAWFVDLWNYSIGPYLLQLIKDSSTQVGFSRSTSEDPTEWVLETSPWETSKGKGPDASCLPLLRLFRYQDSSVIQEQNQVATAGTKPFSLNLSGRSDPLLDMLLHLQVATCYADSVSMSSNYTPSQSFSGLSTASKISAAPSSLHSAAL